jgi:hypothetical protein
MKRPRATPYAFTLELDGIDDPEAIATRLRCRDATVNAEDGLVSLAFRRAALRLSDAVMSAVEDVRRAGVGAQVVRIDGGCRSKPGRSLRPSEAWRRFLV